MKLNLPSTLTQQTARTLFFLILFQIKYAEAGNAFKNCLQDKLNDTTYDALLKYPFTELNPPLNGDGNLEIICCSSSNCRLGNYYSECSDGNLSPFGCTRLNKSIFCSILSKKWCMGIVGGEDILVNHAQAYSSTPDVPALSCLNRKQNISNYASYVLSQGLVGLDKGYAVCGTNKYCGDWEACSWDNNGWTCYSSFCHVQWPAPWPGSIEKNPSTFTFTPTKSIIPTATQVPASPTPISTNDDKILVEKIAIPVGTISGTGIFSWLAYHFYKKKKRKEAEKKAKLELKSKRISKAGENPTLKRILLGNQLEPRNPHITNARNYNDENVKITVDSEIVNNNLTTQINHNQQLRSPHTEYTEMIEETNNPQWIPASNNPQQLITARNPEWSG